MPEGVQRPVQNVIRVEKGSPSDEELAAVTAVLLTRAAAAASPAGDNAHPRPAVAGWRRPERTPRSPGPRSWHTGHDRERRP
nr:acyl-CoA carboxylase subunit epsilon [Streptomyces hygroscopicus]